MKKVLGFLMTTVFLLGTLTACGGGGKTAKRLNGDEVAAGLKKQAVVTDTLDFKKDEEQVFQTKVTYAAKVDVSELKEEVSITYSVDSETNLCNYVNMSYYDYDGVEQSTTEFQKIAKKIISVLDTKRKEKDIDTLIQRLGWQEKAEKVSENGINYTATKDNSMLFFYAGYEEATKRVGDTKFEIDKDKFEENLVSEGFVKKENIKQNHETKRENEDEYTFEFSSGAYTYKFNYWINKSDNKLNSLLISSDETIHNSETELAVKKAMSATEALSEDERTAVINWLFYSSNASYTYKGVDHGKLTYYGSSSNGTSSKSVSFSIFYYE